MLKQNQNLFRLKQIEESCVLEFSLDPSKEFVDLVVFVEPNVLSKTPEEYTDQDFLGHYDREFAWFRFRKVSEYRRKNSTKKYANRASFQAIETGSEAIYGVAVSKSGIRNKFEACLSNFGTIEFRFSLVQFQSKLARLVRRGSETHHYDILERSTFNLYDAFPDRHS